MDDQGALYMKMMFQIGILFLVCLAGHAVSVLLPFPVPGAVIGMIFLFLLLLFKWVKADQMKPLSDFLLKNMAFFFVPAGVNILANLDLVKDKVFALAAVVLLTTVLTFGATALTVQVVIKLQDKLFPAKKKDGDKV